MRTINNQEIAPGLYLYHIQRINQENGENLEEIPIPEDYVDAVELA